MANNFRTRYEVNDATQDILLFDINYSAPTLGKTYRIVGVVLHLDNKLDKAEIVPVPLLIDIDIAAQTKPRYKALIAVCLCAASLLGTGAIALLGTNPSTIIRNYEFVIRN